MNWNYLSKDPFESFVGSIKDSINFRSSMAMYRLELCEREEALVDFDRKVEDLLREIQDSGFVSGGLYQALKAHTEDEVPEGFSSFIGSVNRVLEMSRSRRNIVAHIEDLKGKINSLEGRIVDAERVLSNNEFTSEALRSIIGSDKWVILPEPEESDESGGLEV